MVSFGRKHRERHTAPEEDPEVRQYRFLLREVSPDAVVVAHTEALVKLSEAHREVILSAVQRGLVAGQRLQTGDAEQIAHLLVLGERRSPNAFLSACAPETLRALSQAVIRSEASSGASVGTPLGTAPIRRCPRTPPAQGSIPKSVSVTHAMTCGSRAADTGPSSSACQRLSICDACRFAGNRMRSVSQDRTRARPKPDVDDS